jgi:hypothetical protein
MIQPQFLKPLDVLVLSPKVKFKDHFSKQAPRAFLRDAIRIYQRIKFGWGSNYRGTHCMVYAGKGKFFEVTDPYPRFFTLDFLNQSLVNGDYEYLRVYRYMYRLGEDEVYNYVLEQGGLMATHKYGYEDLIPFALETIIGYSKGAYVLVTSLFGSGWKDAIFSIARLTPATFQCSSGIAALFVGLHKKRGDMFPRPFPVAEFERDEDMVANKQEHLSIERVCPANFESDEDFTLELNVTPEGMEVSF